jgi:hypothetical protein
MNYFFTNFTPFNMNIKNLVLSSILVGLLYPLYGQNIGKISGNFQSNFNVFLRDSVIGATEAVSPQYGSDKSSAEAWLFLNYELNDFTISARYDLFNNSNLLNPSSSYSGQGLGYWQIKKNIGKLELTAGSFYDQIGNGHIFRAYENRLIGIDYAMEGVRAKYYFNDHMVVKVFTGKQKGFPGNQNDRFATSDQIIKGGDLENIFGFKDGSRLKLGVGALNRTINSEMMQNIVSEINAMDLNKRFNPKYNVYALSSYFEYGVKDFIFNGEYNYKTEDNIRDLNNNLFLSDGSIILLGMSYSKRKLGNKKNMGIGFSASYRRVENFPLTVTPYTQLLDGIVTYQPSFTRQAAYRLLARYNAPAQFLGEEAWQAELIWNLDKINNIQINSSDIRDLNGNKLFSEQFIQYERKVSKKLITKFGLQMVFYNQNVYEDHNDYPNVETFTPFTEIIYKLDRKNSIRFEAQYMDTDGDLGSWFNGILEWNQSPSWTVAATNMINTVPQRQSNQLNIPNRVLHYPSFFVQYKLKSTTFSAAYIKQVEGVVCTGGICRIEPAFSGLRFTLNTLF